MNEEQNTRQRWLERASGAAFRGRAAAVFKRLPALIVGVLAACCLAAQAQSPAEPGPAQHARESAAALRAALRENSGAAKARLLASLGARMDDQFTTAIALCLNDPDRDVALAAAAALGQIGSPKAARILVRHVQSCPAGLRDGVAAACLAAADQLRRGHYTNGLPAQIYGAFYSNQFNLENADRYRTAGLEGLVRCEPQPEKRFLIPSLSSSNAALQKAATALAAEPGIDPLPLLDALPKLPPAVQADLIESLSNWPEPAIKTGLLAMLDSPQEAVCLAALRAVAPRANSKDIPHLARLAAARSGAVQELARQALKGLPGPGVNAALVRHLAWSPAPAKIEILRCLAGRKAVEAASPAANALRAREPEVRAAALHSLAVFGGQTQLPAMLQVFLAATNNAGRDGAAQAIEAVCRREGQKSLPAVSAALQSAPKALKPRFFPFLAATGAIKALWVVEPYLDDGQLKTEAGRVAVEIISRLDAANAKAAAPALRKIARSATDPSLRDAALHEMARLGIAAENPPARP